MTIYVSGVNSWERAKTTFGAAHAEIKGILGFPSGFACSPLNVAFRGL